MKIAAYKLWSDPSYFHCLHEAVVKFLIEDGLHSPILTLCITFVKKLQI